MYSAKWHAEPQEPVARRIPAAGPERRRFRGACLAIFNGPPAMAQVYADAAAKRAEAALKDVERCALDIKKPLEDGDECVPFNASLVVAESFVPDAAKSKDITKANKHLHEDETKKAMEALKLVGIDVALTTELVPLKWAKAHVNNAARLIGDAKYYEANLALKTVDDALVFETIDVDALQKTKSGSKKVAVGVSGRSAAVSRLGRCRDTLP